MPRCQATNRLLSDAILQIMKPMNVYAIQHLTARLSSLAPSNPDIRTALDNLIREGKVEVSGFFMKSASYRLSAGNTMGRREKLTDYTESLARISMLAMLARGK